MIEMANYAFRPVCQLALCHHIILDDKNGGHAVDAAHSRGVDGFTHYK